MFLKVGVDLTLIAKTFRYVHKLEKYQEKVILGNT